jgi:FkbM family methyltransferase
MKIISFIKKLSLLFGFYDSARKISWKLRPAQLHAFNEEVSFYKSLISESDLCFDVGANIGDKSEALLKTGAKVVAFEPSSTAMLELQSRCAKYKNWTVVHAAVGNEPDIAVLSCPSDSAKSTLTSNPTREPERLEHVPVVTLNQAIKKFGLPYYCKIDVEGWEYEVFKGLDQTIALISFEFHLNDNIIAITKKCLERLIKLGDATVNITPAESSRFFFKDWMPIKEFLDWFPGDLAETLPGDTYGDIYVKFNR